MGRTRIALLAFGAALAAAVVFAAPGSSSMGPLELTTMLSLNGPASLTYGESLTLSGTLNYETPFSETWGLGDSSVVIRECEAGTSIATLTTDDSGNYSYGPFWPVADSYPGVEAYYAGGTDPISSEITYLSSTSDCVYVNVDPASAQMQITNTLPTTLALGDSLTVGYEVASDSGVDLQMTGGVVSIIETDALGTLNCDDAPLSESQTASGFTATGTLTCTPTAVGSYSYHGDWAGDDNYSGASTSPDATLTVTKGAQQTLSVTGPESAIFGAPDQTITTDGGSGTGAITFDTGDSTACSIVDGMFHVTSATGTCSITATKAADDSYNSTSSDPQTVSITNSYAGTPGTKTCVKNTLRGEETEHDSLKAAAIAHGFANTTGLRKDITTYCKTLN